MRVHRLAVLTWLRVHGEVMLSLRGSALSSRRRPSRAVSDAATRACLLGVISTACVDRVRFCWEEAAATPVCAGSLEGTAPGWADARVA